MNNENKIQEPLASEIIGWLGKQLKSTERLALYAIISLTIVVIGLLAVNTRNAIASEKVNREWIAYLSQYDFVAQDGEGYNYFNSDIAGDVTNGAREK